MTTPDYTGLIREAEEAQEWMRHPDWADDFSLSDIAEWLNQRPTSLLPRLTTTIRTLLESNAALIEHKRKQAEDIMTLGRLVYASSDPLITWMDRAEAAEAKLAEAMKVIKPFAEMRNSYEQRFGKPDPATAAARKFLKENGNGE